MNSMRGLSLQRPRMRRLINMLPVTESVQKPRRFVEHLPAGDKLRVCHLSMTLQTGGLERLLVEYGRWHAAERFELIFAALDDLGPPAAELQRAGFEVISFNHRHIGKARTILQLRRFLKERHIDVLHTHNTYPYFYGGIAGKLAGTPVIVNTQHGRGCGPGWKSLWQFRVANRCGQLVGGVSEDATRLCREQDPGAAGQMECIWNGIDLARFAFAGPAHRPVAIAVGRLAPEKDFETLIQAVPEVLTRFPDFRLQIVGEGVERSRLESRIRELALHDKVELLGERSDIPQLLAQAGFFVCSSQTEGISLTLLEAMAVGLPIVATAVGGNPEIIVPHTTGLLVPPRQPRALASGICQMLEARDRWSELGQAARSRVEEHFCIRRMIAAYEQRYLTLHQQRRPSPSSR